MRQILTALGLLMVVSTELSAQAGDPIDYYKVTNQAELAICRKDLPAAAKYYAKAFQINPAKPFTRDLLKACYCAMDLKDYKVARLHLKRILSRGVEWAWLKSLRADFHGADADSIDTWLALYPNDTLKSGDVVKTIKEMFKRDQAMRQYFSEKNDGDYMKEDSVRDMDEQNGKVLAALFKKYGVPNEDIGNIGYYFSVIVGHHIGGYMSKRSCHEFDTLLFKAIFTYDFHPQNFAKLLQGSEINVSKIPFRYKSYEFHTPLTVECIFVEEDSSIYPQYLAPVIEKEIDKERATIGLETLSELRQKVIFNKSYASVSSSYKKYGLGDGIGSYLDAEDHKQADKYIAEFEKYKPK